MAVSRISTRRVDAVAALSEQLGRDLATKTVLFHQAIAARLGLSATDLKCLDLLRRTGAPLTASNLVELTGLTGGAITGVADRLEKAGLVQRVRDPHDRRRWELRPLPDRAAEIDALFAPLGQGIENLCADYTDTELDAIIDFLTKLGAVMDDQLTRLRR